jgi:hypothetical protein
MHPFEATMQPSMPPCTPFEAAMQPLKPPCTPFEVAMNPFDAAMHPFCGRHATVTGCNASHVPKRATLRLMKAGSTVGCPEHRHVSLTAALQALARSATRSNARHPESLKLTK